MKPYFHPGLLLAAIVAAWPLAVHCSKASTEGYEFVRRVEFDTGENGVAPVGDPLPAIRRVVDETTGRHLLRMDVAAGQREAGLKMPLPLAGAPMLAKVSTALQGKGSVVFTLRSGDGVVSSRTLPLEGHRRWDAFHYRADRHGKELTAELTLQNPGEGDYLEVSSIELRTKAPAELADIPVPPRYYEAGDFFATPLGGTPRGALVTGRISLEALPMPQTSRSLTLYLEYRSPVGDAVVELVSTDQSSRQVIGAAPLAEAKERRWQVIKDVNPRLVGKCLTLRCTPPKGKRLELYRIVATTRADLRPAELEALPPVLPPAPLVAANRTPLLLNRDTWLDEPAWKGATAFGDFRTLRDGSLPEGATEVRFCHDAEHLYVRFNCEEPILRDVEQRTHEFRTRATGADGPVQEDENCFLAFQPREGETFLFWINPRGVIRDARKRGDALDDGWNAGATAAARLEDGRYTLVAAIPLAALGLDRNSVHVPMAVGRNAAARGEVTTWSGGAALESPSRWGTLCFDPVARESAFSPRLPEAVSVGENGLRLGPGGGSASGVLFTSLGEGNARSRAIEPVREGVAEVRLEVPRALGNRVLAPSLTLLADDLTPLYRSPLRRLTVAMPSVQLRLREVGGYQVKMNGRVEAKGRAGEASLTLPLKTGVNDVELVVERREGTVTLEGSGFDADAIRWAEEPGEGGLRRRTTLLLGQTRVWPRPEPAIYFSRGAPQQVPFLFEAAQGQEEWMLNVALPPGFEVVGASSIGAWRSGLHPRFKVREAGRREIGGQTCTVFEIVADRRLPKAGETPRLARALSLWLVLRPTAQAGDSGEIHYWSRSAEGRVNEARRSFRVKVLPHQAGGKPGQSQWQLWGPLEQLDDDAAREALLQMTLEAGINRFEIGHAGITAGRFGKKGTPVPVTMRVHFLNGSLFFGPYLRQHPQHCLVNYNGNPDPSRVCTSALLDEAWSEADRLVRGQIAEFGPHTVLYDYEFSPLYRGKMHTCYCPRCLEAFRSHAGLARDLSLDAARINETYARQWVDFMARQTARIFARMKATVNAVDPKIRFEVYSGYQSEENPARYGVNWDYVGATRAVDQAGLGYGRPLEAIRATKKALPGVTLLFGEIIEPYRTVDDIPSRQTTPARLLRRLLDSQNGVLLYEMSAMDARSWKAVAETTRLVARYETALLKGVRAEIPGIEESAGCRVSEGGLTLYCLMNDSPLEKRWRLPEATRRNGREFYTGQSPDKEGYMTVPPGDSRVVVVEKESKKGM